MRMQIALIAIWIGFVPAFAEPNSKSGSRGDREAVEIAITCNPDEIDRSALLHSAIDYLRGSGQLQSASLQLSTHRVASRVLDAECRCYWGRRYRVPDECAAEWATVYNKNLLERVAHSGPMKGAYRGPIPSRGEAIRTTHAAGRPVTTEALRSLLGAAHELVFEILDEFRSPGRAMTLRMGRLGDGIVGVEGLLRDGRGTIVLVHLPSSQAIAEFSVRSSGLWKRFGIDAY